MQKQHCVIIGGSHAGCQLAASLRQEGWKGGITLIGAEPQLPYQRPPLSKDYLAGSKGYADLLIRPASFYEKAEIDLLLGTCVEAIDTEKRTLQLHDGGEVPYTHLALATGARVRHIALVGQELEGVLYLRELCDVDRIRQFVGTGKRAVIIGGGYVGLETAASLRQLGMQVTVLEAMPRILARVTAAEVSTFFARVHHEEGVRILTDVTVEALQGERAVQSVRLANGEVLPADLVILGVGVVAETTLAEQAGLEVEDGICVDEFTRTSAPDIVAVGDCTRHFNRHYGRRLRLESVQNALDQAKVAARTLCGTLEPYDALPWFWSDQFDVKLQIAGLSQGYNRTVIRGDWQSGRSFAVFYFLGERLLAVDAVNRPKEFMMVRRALVQHPIVDCEMLADDTVPLQSIFPS